MAKRKKSLAKKLHKWPGLIVGLLLIFFSVSGILMNHRTWISSFDVQRKYLPESYAFQNWNRSAIRGSYKIAPDSLLVYGNAGIWLTGSSCQSFVFFSQGIPDAADQRKTYDVISFKNRLFAATNFGLYSFQNQWEKVEIPMDGHRVVDLAVIDSELYILTRSKLFKCSKNDLSEFEKVDLPPPEDYKKELSLFKTLWDIHSGEFLGLPGKLIVDLMGLIVFVLSLTGIIFFFNPRFRRWFKVYKKYTPRKLTKWSLTYHNKLGKYTFIIIGLIALTGMFLRPPLLIPVANVQVPVIPYTHYDQPNPWYDKLRAMLYDEQERRILFSTSEGMYYSGEDFKGEMMRFDHQPIVSVMGINVFEKIAPGDYLVGSFSGLYRWKPDQRYLMNVVNLRPAGTGQGIGNPFGGTAVAGFIENKDGKAYLFDYNRGAVTLGHTERFGKMPEKLSEEGDVSLWNLALEVHTGRIYSFFLGDFYILIVPLAGLTTIIVVISGYIIYRKRHRRFGN